MGFTWNASGEGYKLTVNEISEVKTNVNYLYSRASKPAYSWTVTPPTIDTNITINSLVQIRAALDYIKDNNVCSAEYAAHLAANYASYNPVICSVHNSGIYNTLFNAAWVN